MEVLAELAALLPALSVLALAGLVLLGLGRRRLGAAGLGLAGALLVALSTPLVSDGLRGALEARFPPEAAEDAPRADAIVLLGGGVTPPAPPREVPDLSAAADRVHHAARLYHAGRAPLVVATGGAPLAGVSQAEAMARVLGELGVPREDVLLEEESANTYGNARETKPLLERRGLETVLLVTSALHMPRALATFRSAGIEAIPAPTDHEVVERDAPLLLRLVPHADALRGSAAVFHELVGGAYYRARGWIAGEAAQEAARPARSALGRS